jgi:hypothetical protein
MKFSLLLFLLFAAICVASPVDSDKASNAALVDNDANEEKEGETSGSSPSCCVCPEAGYVGLLLPDQKVPAPLSPSAASQLAQMVAQKCEIEQNVAPACPVCPNARVLPSGSKSLATSGQDVDDDEEKDSNGNKDESEDDEAEDYDQDDDENSNEVKETSGRDVGNQGGRSAHIINIPSNVQVPVRNAVATVERSFVSYVSSSSDSYVGSGDYYSRIQERRPRRSSGSFVCIVGGAFGFLLLIPIIVISTAKSNGH